LPLPACSAILLSVSERKGVLTSSRSRKRDGIPPLAAWVSCFLEACLPWCHSGLVLQPLHRLEIPQALRYVEGFFFNQTQPEIERQGRFPPDPVNGMGVHRQTLYE
jgi:hypothetical protein